MTPKEIERELRSDFEARLPGMIERRAKSRTHRAIPNQHFAAASAECRDAYVEGRYTSAIMTCQAVAEGLGKFLAAKNGLAVVTNPKSQADVLQKNRSNPAISPGCFKAFGLIRGEDRDDIHHMNEEVVDVSIEERARECVEALYQIESEIFEFDVREGMISPKFPQYWPSDGDTVGLWLK